MSVPLRSARRLILVLSTFLVACSRATGVAAPRQDQVISSGWKFIRDDAGLSSPTDAWTSVTVPHTWNTKSADQGDHHDDPHFKSGYYRGACWYAKALDIPAGWKDKRVFIRFEAAALVAKTYLNGQFLGEHRGGFTAFCYELTPYLHFGAANELRVQVDNSRQEDVPPLSGDFNIDGGIYRPVHLLTTDPVCVSPLEMASPGVYLTTRSLQDAAAQIEVKALISNGLAAAAPVQVKTEIADASGRVVATQTRLVPVEPGQTQEVVTNLNLPAPHRWNGRQAPYLYTATVSLAHGTEAGDSVSQLLGLRTVEITQDRGFLLNGRPYPIHGVNRHQDWGDQGWAASTANDDEDARLILEMGVTAIRLAHYPQSDYWHDLCDHNGLLLWNEVSLVNEVGTTPGFAANAEQQLRELILQRYNHPSVAFWGIFNELKPAPDPETLLEHLKSVVRQLDSSRLIVCAIAKRDVPYNHVADYPCFNQYPGWYDHLKIDAVIQANAREAGQRVGLSEYGAGANPAQHEEGVLVQPQHKGPFHPEEWQTHVHAADWAAMQDNPLLWGVFVWVMFDFQVASRHEGSQPDLNDKGLVTQDRRTKKDAYFFYQANWTDTPMVHIASSRMTPRRQAVTAVEIFSNCDKVELSVNGKALDPVPANKVKVFVWPSVQLQPGKNVIRATAGAGATRVADSCEWLLDPESAPSEPVTATQPSTN